MHLKEFTQINHLQFCSVVYSESDVKVDKYSKTTEITNGTILVDAANQNPASICILEK